MNKFYHNNKLRYILNKKFLYEHYILLDKSACQIAEETKCSSSTVLFYLKKFKFKIKKINASIVKELRNVK